MDTYIPVFNSPTISTGSTELTEPTRPLELSVSVGLAIVPEIADASATPGTSGSTESAVGVAETTEQNEKVDGYEYKQDFVIQDPIHPSWSEKLNMLNLLFSLDFYGSDFKWALFVAAAKSEQYKRKLIPFPPDYIKCDGKWDIEELRAVIDITPGLYTIWYIIRKTQHDLLNNKVIDLVFWVTAQNKCPVLKEIRVDDFMKTLPEHTKSLSCILKIPNQVFLVEEPNCSYLKNVEEMSTVAPEIGFYSTQMENYYTLLCNGFTTVEDDSILLKKTLDPKMSPKCEAWRKCASGDIIRCVGVCAYVPQLEQTKEFETPSGSYIQVKDTHGVLLKYLVLYGYGKEEVTAVEKKPVPAKKSYFSKLKPYIFSTSILFFFTSIVLIKSNVSLIKKIDQCLKTGFSLITYFKK